MNVLSRDEQRLILNLMCRSNGISDIVEITGHSPNTVRRHLARFGEALIASFDRHVRGIAPSRIEVDEIWSYVHAKRECNVAHEDRKRPLPADYGAFYTWTALDPDSKLLLGFRIGDRGYKTGLAFLVDLSARITGRPLITSDAHGPYPDAITKAFGGEVDHVVLKKEFKKWYNPETREAGNVLSGLEKVPQNQTKVDLSLASTSLVERMNASIRNYVSRFTRSTYKFSKLLENHVHAQAVFVMYYISSPPILNRHDSCSIGETC
jgi:IS1 family transposase